MRPKEMPWAKGFALPAALLVLLMLSALSAAMILVVNSETRMHTADGQNAQAYYGAEAAMEKMMVDLNALYLSQQAPSVSAIQALGNSSNRPSLSSITYSEYSFTVPNTGGVPTATTKTISGGPNQGLIAEVIPLTLTATASQANSMEVKMIRNVEVALIPVFQFGIFSESDLCYFPGLDYDFAGRVHTNGNLFLAAYSGANLIFHSKTTAVGEIVRTEHSNTVPISTSGQTGTILIPTAAAGCDGSKPNCRALAQNEGSKVGGLTSANNTSWNSISTSTYGGWIANGTTGVKPLTLPFVSTALRPIQVIRRPPPGGDSNTAMASSRLYNHAQIRVLLSDSPADLPGGAGDSQNVQLANVGTYASGVPVPGALNTYFAEGKYYATSAGGCTKVDTDWVPAVTPAATGCTSWPLIDSYLRVEARQSDGSYTAVTQEWLQLGFARGLAVPNSETGTANSVHPNAILIFQQQADRSGNGNLTDSAYTSGGTYYAAESTTVTGVGAINNWYPINLYDTREGEVRDTTVAAANITPGGTTTTSVAIGGIMNVVELDVGNLRRWLTGAIGSTGTQTESSTQNGYILYFSDRRGMLPNEAAQRVGEYGFEDVINPGVSNGLPDGALATAEDVNQNGSLQTYGRANVGDGFTPAAQGNDNLVLDVPTYRLATGGLTIARKNRVTGARHALKLINGTRGNLPTKPDATGGFTVASENPVYLRGNYNANASGFGDPHAAAAIIADAVTLLSGAWNDLNSFKDPTFMGVGSPLTSRAAATSWYRAAIAAGKGISFPQPAGTDTYFGTDGGPHNFLRLLEFWYGRTLNYRGSLASLFYSEYGVGTYKCCTTVYTFPTRNFSFDADFLDPVKLPPGTPRFQDVVNLGYQQVFTP